MRQDCKNLEKLLSAPALHHQAERTVLILLLLRNLETLLSAFIHHSMVSVALSHLIQKTVYRPSLLPKLQVSHQFILSPVPAKTYVVAVFLLNHDLSGAG